MLIDRENHILLPEFYRYKNFEEKIWNFLALVPKCNFYIPAAKEDELGPFSVAFTYFHILRNSLIFFISFRYIGVSWHLKKYKKSKVEAVPIS